MAASKKKGRAKGPGRPNNLTETARRQLGGRLRLIREDRSVQEFSHRLKVSPWSVYEWERGSHTPSFEILRKLAVKEQVDLNWLVLG